MGIDPAMLPERVKRCLAEPERKELKLELASERQARLERNLERDEQNLFRGWLERNQYAYYNSGTHKPTSANLGVPDFIIGCAVGLAIEFKRPGGKLTREQARWKERHTDRSGLYFIAYSYQEAVAITEAYGKRS